MQNDYSLLCKHEQQYLINIPVSEPRGVCGGWAPNLHTYCPSRGNLEQVTYFWQITFLSCRDFGLTYFGHVKVRLSEKLDKITFTNEINIFCFSRVIIETRILL